MLNQKMGAQNALKKERKNLYHMVVKTLQTL